MLDFKALLFDLDGTLLDTAPDFITAINKQLKRHGRNPLVGDAIRTSVTHGSIGIIESAYNIKQDHPEFEPLKEEFLQLYLDNISEKTGLFDGLRQVLDSCKERNIPWGIVTNKPLKYTAPLMADLGLDKQSATTICPDHVANPKPDPEALILACSQINIAPKNCIYIGDHVRDIQAGKSAGMPTIAAQWGYIEEFEDVTQWQADMVVKKSTDLHSLLFC
ncbi:HAD-IA family hydrolase [Porticoccaceae bacterium]|jgi:N-acetyl-D-muramate 6-phosphate phosphatase|nr:HAD-IA family hydrolase [Porticoccaceae bacterium]MDA9014610.1 HAD-IA family hydrolase [Porticoccaceae bacterium]